MEERYLLTNQQQFLETVPSSVIKKWTFSMDGWRVTTRTRLEPKNGGGWFKWFSFSIGWFYISSCWFSVVYHCYNNPFLNQVVIIHQTRPRLSMSPCHNTWVSQNRCKSIGCASNSSHIFQAMLNRRAISPTSWMTPCDNTSWNSGGVVVLESFILCEFQNKITNKKNHWNQLGRNINVASEVLEKSYVLKRINCTMVG